MASFLAFIANGFYQVWQKPAEVFSLVGLGQAKTPYQTWVTYKDQFHAYETPTISAELLASLAHIESNGNPLATPGWTFRLSSNWDQVFAPATSAVGLFQFTNGTFEMAKQWCDQSPQCPSSWFYSRLWPEHSIRLAANYLNRSLREVLPLSNMELPEQVKQQVVGIIHLCGKGKGLKFVRSGFSLDTVGYCGAHNARSYVNQLHSLNRQFTNFCHKNSY